MDSEACSDQRLVNPSGSLQPESRTAACGRARCAAAFAASLAACATIRAATRATRPPDQAGAGTLSLARSSDLVDSLPDTGCSNWYSIMLEPEEPSMESAPEACLSRCRMTPGCTGFNYQKTESCALLDGSQAATGRGLGACYLVAGSCTTEVNACWDLYVMKTPTRAAWTESRPNTGCSNWKQIMIDELKVSNFDACGKKCSEKIACQRFNFRTGGESSTNCLLFNGDCDHEENALFNLYRMKIARPSGSVSWSLLSLNTGCRNWNTAAMGSVSLEYDAYLCGKRCESMPACKQFNWQKEDGGLQLDGKHDHEGHSYGACYIYFEECDQELNVLWDLYQMGAAAPVATATPAPTHESRLPAIFCPKAADIHSASGAAVTIRDQGWTIQGEGHVSTSATFNLIPEGNRGWLAFTLDISEMKTGKDGANFIASETFVSFPDGHGPYDAVAQACSSLNWQGNGDLRFCEELEMIETNGRSAYGVSWRLAPAHDETINCRSHQDPSMPRRGTCRTENFFTTSSPAASCTAAAGQVIDSSQPFDVWALFSQSGGMTVTLVQGDRKQTITSGELVMGTEQPDSGSAAIINFAMKTRGAAVESVLFSSGWAPGSELGGCPQGLENIAQSKLRVSNLRFYGQKLRGEAAECEDQTQPTLPFP